MSSIVKQQLDPQEKNCIKVRVQHKEMSYPDAFEAFKVSDMLKGHVEANEISTSLFTFSWFLTNKSFQIISGQ